MVCTVPRHVGHVTTTILGFTISLYEYEATIPTLWNAVKGDQFNHLFFTQLM